MAHPLLKKIFTFFKRLAIFAGIILTFVLLLPNDFKRLHIHIQGKGSVLPPVKTLHVGRDYHANLLARPLPGTGLGFREWAGTISSTSPEITVEMKGRERSITAIFSDTPPPGVSFQKVTIQCAGPGSGTTDPAPGSWVFRNDWPEAFTALPDKGSFFGGWEILPEDTGAGESTSARREPFPTCTLPTERNLTAIAWFYRSGALITLETEGQGWYGVPVGTYPLAAGTEVTLRAAAEEGWHLSRIEDEKGQIVLASDNPRWADFSFRVNENKTYRAVFEPLEKRIQVCVDSPPPTAGLVFSGASPCPPVLHALYGSALTLEARPLNHESAFAGWSGTTHDGISHDALLTLPVTADASLTAHFVPAQCFLDLEAEIDGEPAMLPAGALKPMPGLYGFTGQEKDIQSLEACWISDLDIAFLRWEGDLPEGADRTQRLLHLPMTASRKVRACFTRHNLVSLSVEKEKGSPGTLTPAPGHYRIPAGTQLTLQAVPAAERFFGGWKITRESGEEQVAITPSLTVTAEEGMHASAVFGRGACSLHLASTHPEAEIIPAPGDYTVLVGTPADFIAKPPEGLIFHYWRSFKKGILSENPLLRVVLEEDDGITAVFGLPLYSLQLTAEGKGHIDRDWQGIEQFEEGTYVQLHATPDPDAVFLCWEGDLPANALPAQPKILVLMDQDKALTARFAPADWQLDIRLDLPAGMPAPKLFPPPGLSGRTNGEAVPLMAIPPANSNLVFIGWEGDLLSPDPVRNLIMDGDKVITARFAPAKATEHVRLTVLRTEGSSLSVIRDFDPGLYHFAKNAQIPLTAILSDDAYFGGWTGDMDQDAVYTDKMLCLDRDKTVGLQTGSRGAVLTVFLDGNGAGQISPPPGVYRLAENMTITLQAVRVNTEYHFDGWYTGAGELLSRMGKYRFTIQPGISRMEITGVFRDYVLPPPLVLCWQNNRCASAAADTAL